MNFAGFRYYLKEFKNNSFYETIIHFRNYLGSNVATKAIGFISLPIYTHLLTPGEYGFLNVFNAYAAMFVIVFTCNSQAAIGQFYLKNNGNDFKSFFSTNVLFTFSILSVSLPLLFFLRKTVSDVFEIPYFLIVYFIPIILLNTVSSTLLQIFQSKSKSGLLSKLSIFQSYGAFIISIPLLFILEKEKYMALIWAQVITGSLVCMYSIRLLKEYFEFTFSFRHLNYILTFALPLIPYVLSSVILDQIDRIMINKFQGERETGLYSFAYNIAMLISLVYFSLYSAWYPKYAAYMNEGRHEEHDKDLKKILQIVAFFATGLILFSKELGIVMASKSFHESLYIIPIIIIGYLFHAIFYIYGRNIGHFEKPFYLSLIVLLSGIVNILLNIIFIPVYGNIAAAYTTLVSYFIMAFLAWSVNKYWLKFYTTSLIFSLKPFWIVMPAVILYYLLEWFQTPFFASLTIKIILILAYILYQVKGFLSAKEADVHKSDN